MVKVSTLFIRVDEFDESNVSSHIPYLLDQDKEDQFLKELLKPLVFDPDDRLVQNILKKGALWGLFFVEDLIILH